MKKTIIAIMALITINSAFATNVPATNLGQDLGLEECIENNQNPREMAKQIDDIKIDILEETRESANV